MPSRLLDFTFGLVIGAGLGVGAATSSGDLRASMGAALVVTGVYLAAAGRFGWLRPFGGGE